MFISSETETPTLALVAGLGVGAAIFYYRSLVNAHLSRGLIVEAVRWHNFDEVCRTFRDVDFVDGHVIFNITHNRYRLMTVIHYAKATNERHTQGHVYIRSFLTHKEYDNPRNWDRRCGKQ